MQGCRPICLLSHIHKLFTKVICDCLTKQFYEQQPRDLVRFKSECGTWNDLSVLSQLLKKLREYEFSLGIAFADYKKKHTEHNVLLNARYDYEQPRIVKTVEIAVDRQCQP